MMTKGDLTRQVTTAIEDGRLVMGAALICGLEVQSLPRQVVFAGPPGAVVRPISAVQGVVALSSLVGLNIAQDRRLWRAILQRSGIKVSRGATFSIQGRKAMRRFARQLGYPVLLRPAIGPNPGALVHTIMDDEELDKALEALRRRRADKDGIASDPTLSAYAQTELSAERESADGLLYAPDFVRFMVEHQISGPRWRILVCGDQVVAEMQMGGGDSEIEAAPSKIRAMAVAALAAVPGLNVATIDVGIDTDTVPGTPRILNLSERPRLESFGKFDPQLAMKSALTILGVEALARRVEVQTQELERGFRLRAIGLGNVDAAISALGKQARALDLSLELFASGDIGKPEIIGRISGPCASVATLVEQSMNGLIPQARAMSMVLSPEPSHQL